MSNTIEEHITIPSNVNYANDLDFEHLRDLGQTYIEDLSRKIWTDYNIHDPGITIMELLCYAITDLGLRIDQPIKNLVAAPDYNFTKMHEQFKSAKNILTTKPVTALDYRKLFIDIDGVKNCWMAKHKLPLHAECNPEDPKVEFSPFEESTHETTSFLVKGLYSILVDFEDDDTYDEATLKAKIFEKYHQNRNLCEDLITIKKVPKQCIKVCAEIQLDTEADEEYIHAKIQWIVSEYLSPGVNTFSLSEMLDKDLTSDEIFHGPILENGFITEDELQKSELRTQVRLSDLINLIMQIDGVKLIEDISIDNCAPKDEASDCTSELNNNSNPWLICVKEGHLPVLCDESSFSYKKGFLPIGINTERSDAFYNTLEEDAYNRQKKSFDDLPMPLGKHSNLSYKTIQHDLPENYGISTYGLPTTATDKRRVQAKQLQAYLLFFDQILSTYFSHLEHVKTLLTYDTDLQRTYFFKAVEGIEGIDTLVNNYSKYKTNVEGIIDELEDFQERRNELLNHLISRFAEVFEDYSSAMYKLFGRDKQSVENNIIHTKNKFLKQYDIISSERGLAFNYTNPNYWDTNNVSGFQKRIALLSGMADYNRKDLFNKAMYIDTLERRNSDDEVYFEYRWLLKGDNTVYLSSREDYNTKQAAIDNLLYALTLATDHTNFYLDTTGSGKFYVALKDKDGTTVGRQYNHYYSILENAENRKANTIAFIASIVFEEGFYVIENILTLPYKNNSIGDLNTYLPLCVEEDCSTCSAIDPFSYQVTIIFPGYTTRFSNIDFRTYMENLIRRELPAHILPRICWVGHVDGSLATIEENEIITEDETPMIDYSILDPEDQYDIKNIQESWKTFLASKKRKSNGYMASHNATKNLLRSINDLNTIYPTGTLHDCNNDSDELNGKIILNRSALGSL